ncbi:hypothetical protein, partial [Streptomyces scabiei]|uniref:hypothetical protein n=1 Tax=Streptomyces scabiei TaxID=1930 RepID=UPI001C4FEAD2
MDLRAGAFGGGYQLGDGQAGGTGLQEGAEDRFGVDVSGAPRPIAYSPELLSSFSSCSARSTSP